MYHTFYTTLPSRLFIILFVFIFSSNLTAQINDTSKQAQVTKMFEEAMFMQNINIDSTITLLQNCLIIYEELEDNKGIDETKIKLVTYYVSIGQYHHAYNIAIEMYNRFEQINNTAFQIELLRKLTVLYLIFEQNEKANELVVENFDNLHQISLQSNDSIRLQYKLYSLLAYVEFKANKDYLKAEDAFLKSFHLSMQLADKRTIKFVKLRLADLYVNMYRINDAGKLLSSLMEDSVSIQKPFHAQLFNVMGKYYNKKEELDSSIIYFEKSLTILNATQKHKNTKVNILTSLSQQYFIKENYLKAYNYLKEAKQINESIFGSKSMQNREIFEMKNKYASELKMQKLSILEKEQRILQLRSIVYTGSLFVIIVLILLYLKRKVKIEKLKRQVIQEKQQIEMDKKEEILEVRNKELLSSAMQLLERDNQLDEIKNTLNTLDFKDENKATISKVIQSFKINRSQKWNEFDVHFTAVNHSFFLLLKEMYPSLTKTELKICAFIKLGFSSKEMAQIMGLGVDGINTSRYRIRKKMNINKGCNLIDYIQNIG
ncbi:LuxR C-terminal-related transcriptional regulator [Saccharicrinis aurantiacus]|uniref:LuxR C-terminal-related transcriptional regulator n=1 Tax=Saccharicrinis aurantiacus TaxID=1849719 RepID=UPI000838F5A9|nr:LuxR C-terminal-related transcriptional regulator [Saccharicrinis aurantiacus]